MEPVFYRINQAIYYTVEYYEIHKIKDHIFKFAGELNLEYLDSWVKTTFELQGRMEDEINQTIFTQPNNETKSHLYRLLVSGLGDYRIKSINVGLIEREIDAYNERVYSEFLEKHKADEAAFLNHEDYNKRAHLEEYETSNTSDPIYIKYFTQRHTHYKYYCIKDKIPFIDKKFLPDYIALITPIIVNFRNILLRHTAENTSLYNAAKLPSVTTFLIGGANPMPEDNARKLLPNVEAEPRDKIKVSLSVPQLVYLFKMLNDLSPAIFDIKTKSELYRFISANFTTKGKENDDISTAKIKNLFSDTDKSVAIFWADYLKKMLEQARKV